MMKHTCFLIPILSLLPAVGGCRAAEPNPRMVLDFGSFNLHDLYAFGDTLYFTRNSAPDELWKSDGTPGGTVMVKANLGNAGEKIAVGSTVYFTVQNGTDAALWKTNGTTAGTVLVKDGLGTNGAPPQYLTPYNGSLYFRANIGSGSLWKSNGTAAGTTMVKPDFHGHPYSLTVVNGSLYFAVTEFATGTELYKTNGTAAGTVLFKDLLPGQGGSDPNIMGVAGNTLFVRAFGDPLAGTKIWKVDAVSGNAVQLGNRANGGGYGDALLHIADVMGGALYYASDDPVLKTELWKTTDSPPGTVLVKDINRGLGGGPPDSSPTSLYAAGNTLYFGANDGFTGFELWKSDGTTEGTVLVKDLVPGTGGSDPGPFTAAGDAVYFFAKFEEHGIQVLWKTDGTAAGTQRLSDLDTWAGRSYAPVLSGSRLYFLATPPGTTGQQLWVYETQRPVPGPVTAIPVDETRVKLRTTVNPRGLATQAYFEYGFAPGFGNYHTFYLTPDNGTEPQQVEVELAGLTPQREYRCRLVVQSAGGREVGDDITFTPSSLTPQQSWRLTHFGAAEDAGDAADDADPDGDGRANRLEYLAGTDPNDKASAFLVEITGPPDVNESVTFGPVRPGVRYTVQSSADPTAAWTDWPAAVYSEAASYATLTDPAPAPVRVPRRFFRVRLEMEP